MNTPTPTRRESDTAEHLRELARIAAEWGHAHYPTPPVVLAGDTGRGTLAKFPWE